MAISLKVIRSSISEHFSVAIQFDEKVLNQLSHPFLKYCHEQIYGFSFLGKAEQFRQKRRQDQESRWNSLSIHASQRRSGYRASMIYSEKDSNYKTENMSQLSQIITELSQNCLYLKALKQGKRLYTINVNDLKTISPYSVFQLIRKVNSRSESTGGLAQENTIPCENPSQECWYPSEFKLFSWIAVCYAFIIGREIHQFKTHHTDFISNVFRKKKPTFIKYNLLCLQKQSKGKKEVWSQEEKNLFVDILKDESLKGKWSDISYNLYCRSDLQFYRSSHNCREMWYNHLNPVVNHNKWTLKEDIQLFDLAGKIGTKWAKISKALEGVRTEHMVKNRFNSISKKYQSRFQRCSQKKMIELISSHLLKKLAQEEEQEESMSNNQEEEANSQSDPSITVKKEDSIIEEEEEQEEEREKGELTNGQREQQEEPEQQIKKEEFESNQEVIIPINQPEEQPERHLPEEKNEGATDIEPRAIGQYEYAYPNLNVEPMVCETNLEELVARRENVVLIDYLNYDPQYKQTIFSGTNS